MEEYCSVHWQLYLAVGIKALFFGGKQHVRDETNPREHFLK